MTLHENVSWQSGTSSSNTRDLLHLEIRKVKPQNLSSLSCLFPLFLQFVANLPFVNSAELRSVYMKRRTECSDTSARLSPSSSSPFSLSFFLPQTFKPFKHTMADQREPSKVCSKAFFCSTSTPPNPLNLNVISFSHLSNQLRLDGHEIQV